MSTKSREAGAVSPEGLEERLRERAGRAARGEPQDRDVLAGVLTEAADALAAARAEVERKDAALATLAAFARTAPGRLPAHVQEAVDLVPWDGAAVRRAASPTEEPSRPQGGADA